MAAAARASALAPRAAAELGGKILLARQSVPARPGPHAPAQRSPWPGESARHGSFG